MGKMKKGDTWISGVLYIALGVVVVSMLLTAGNPIIERLRDRNVILQTKEVMIGVNNAVRTVIAEGPGSQRSIIVEIGKGDFFINGESEMINWSLETRAVLSEPDLPVREGDLEILTSRTSKTNVFKYNLVLRYASVADIILIGDTKLVGRHNLIVRNRGINVNGKVDVEIREVS